MFSSTLVLQIQLMVHILYHTPRCLSGFWCKKMLCSYGKAIPLGTLSTVYLQSAEARWWNTLKAYEKTFLFTGCPVVIKNKQSKKTPNPISWEATTRRDGAQWGFMVLGCKLLLRKVHPEVLIQKQSQEYWSFFSPIDWKRSHIFIERTFLHQHQ